MAGRDVKEGREDGPEPCDRRGEAQRGARPLTEDRPTEGRGLAARKAISRPLSADFAWSAAGVRMCGGRVSRSAICGTRVRSTAVGLGGQAFTVRYLRTRLSRRVSFLNLHLRMDSGILFRDLNALSSGADIRNEKNGRRLSTGKNL